jgi:hypothetical protein
MRNFEVMSDSYNHAACVVEEEHGERVPEERLLQEVLQPERSDRRLDKKCVMWSFTRTALLWVITQRVV